MPPLVQSLSLYVPMNARSLLFSLASLPSLASLSVFKDVDNNLTVLKKHYALGVYGKLKFHFKPHYVSME